MTLIKQKGYILLESLVCLVILNVVILSMIQILPIMIETRHQLDLERVIFNTLYEIYDQKQFYQKAYPDSLSFTEPIPFTVHLSQETICATYIWRDEDEKEICLF